MDTHRITCQLFRWLAKFLQLQDRLHKDHLRLRSNRVLDWCCWKAWLRKRDNLFVYLLHQVHDAFKGAFLISSAQLFLLKQPTDVTHDFGLLLIALVVLLTEVWLVGIQPLRVLVGWIVIPLAAIRGIPLEWGTNMYKPLLWSLSKRGKEHPWTANSAWWTAWQARCFHRLHPRRHLPLPNRDLPVP